ncbi:MAG: type II toxin-antitoxin system VapC family toxin [Chloroflexi bacterium]|nr:type II toxin-antitoxin system VapC family toxin [Chloroflexota bacterium]
MPAFYLDSSGLAKRYKPEKGSDIVHELFQGTDSLITSYLTLLDMLAVARRLLGGGQITREAYDLLTNDILEDFSSSLQVESITGGIMGVAAQLSRQYGLEGSDSIQLATALSVQPPTADQPPQCVLVSSDRRMGNVYSALGGQALDPEDAGARELLGKLRVS